MKHEIEIVEVICGRCKVIFFLTRKHQQQLRESHTKFYCPNGCCRVYPGTSAEKRISEARTKLSNSLGKINELQNTIKSKNYLLDEEKKKTKSYKMHLAKAKKKEGKL